MTAGERPVQDETCKGCSRRISGTDWTCPHCGHTRWGMVLGTGAFGLLGVGLAVAPDSPIWLRIVGGLLGAPALLVGVTETITGIRGGRSPKQGGEGPAWGVLHWAALGLVALAIAAGVLGVVWNGQRSEVEAERDALMEAIDTAEGRLADLNDDFAGKRSDIAEMEDQLALAESAAAALMAQAADLDASVATRSAAFDADTADEVALAESLADLAAVLGDLVRLDGEVASELGRVAADYARGVDEGNFRNLAGLNANVAAETLEELTGGLERALAAVAEATASVEALSATGEAGDGG